MLTNKRSELTEANIALAAENRRLGGDAWLPSWITTHEAIVTDVRASTALPLLPVNAALEAEIARLLATNAALSVENRLLERASRDSEAKAKRDADTRARAAAEAKLKAEEDAKREAEARVKREVEERVRKEAEEKARKEAEERAAREAQEKAQKEAQEKARREAEENAKAALASTSRAQPETKAGSRSPRSSPRTGTKIPKPKKIKDGFYKLPDDGTKRFVRVVGDQVMVRGGGGFCKCCFVSKFQLLVAWTRFLLDEVEIMVWAS